MFPDGRPYVLTFNQVEQRYYAAFVDEFPEADVSISQWRGGYEYQTLYPAIQMMVENGIQTLDALNEILGVIAATNQSIYRPAVLQSRVTERFKQAGYEATARVADIDTRGIVAICVDQERAEYPRTMTIGINQDDTDQAGYGDFQMGELDFKTLPEGQTITLFASSGDGTSGYTYIRMDGDLDDSDGLSITFTGYISGSFSFVPDASDPNPSRIWVCIDPVLATALRGGNGQTTQFSIAGLPVNEPVNDDDALIGNLIRDEMLPAGQHMEGNIVYPTALSNGQSLNIRWSTPIKFGNNYRVTITRARGSQFPMDSIDQIIAKFNENFAALMGIGRDITPQRYLTPHDLPWATSVFVEWADGYTWRSDDQEVPFNVQYDATLPPANVMIV